MSKYRQNLPQLTDKLFITDGGIETSLIYNDGFELPDFASFVLLDDEKGRQALRTWFEQHASIARQAGTGFILESATWRGSRDWGLRLGYNGDRLAELNRSAIDLLERVRDEYESAESPMVISGCVGPRGDGYDPGSLMTADEAHTYHADQIGTLATTAADMISAMTMTNTAEAIGVVRAASDAGMPAAVSFTVETDGTLPTGQPLSEAIEAVDASTGRTPAYFMINCAHPTHFEHVLGGAWMKRLRGIRANASACSHAELDAAQELDDGDPEQLAEQFAELHAQYSNINVLGGCCGTDHRHIRQIARLCA